MWNRTVMRKALIASCVLLTGAGILYSLDSNSKGSGAGPVPANKHIQGAVPAGKHLALLKVDLSTLESIPESGSDSVTLIGRIFLNQEAPQGIGYEWTVPDDVQVLEGQRSEEGLQVPTGKTYEVRLKVQGFTKESQKTISLQAYATRGGEKLGSSAVIVSRMEDTFEAAAPKIRQAVEEATKKKTKLPRGF